MGQNLGEIMKDRREHELLDKHFQAALDVQGACNLSGLVYAFSEAMTVLHAVAMDSGKSTVWKNKHPISFLFSVQVAHLTGTNALCADSEQYTMASRACEMANADNYFAWLKKRDGEEIR